MIEIPLNKNKIAIIDDQDYELVSQYTWYFSRGYALSCKWDKKTKKDVRYMMHRLILQPPKHLDIDHINGDGLDNQRNNLRIATRQQNIFNRKGFDGAASKFKGVSRAKGMWKAGIKVNYRNYYIGYFKSEVAAAMAYDIAAKDLFKEFARLNFPNAIHG